MSHEQNHQWEASFLPQHACHMSKTTNERPALNASTHVTWAKPPMRGQLSAPARMSHEQNHQWEASFKRQHACHMSKTYPDAPKTSTLHVSFSQKEKTVCSLDVTSYLEQLTHHVAWMPDYVTAALINSRTDTVGLSISNREWGHLLSIL